ncbi:MmgE/PrpD family protein [Streptomyces sp. NPDC050560]|uniref:MmgE/PrpD family protein n=1 Tax=Streptomyces sp. NPDC050560 TaxID=3365630 RepID=UPI0037ACCA43
MSATEQAVDFVRTAKPPKEALEQAAGALAAFRAAAQEGAAAPAVRALHEALAGTRRAAGADPTRTAWKLGTAAAAAPGSGPDWAAVCAAAVALAPRTGADAAPPTGQGPGPRDAGQEPGPETSETSENAEDSADPEELVAAVAVGIEVARATAAALGAAHSAAGWSLAGTAGTVGAGAAAGRLLGLDAARLRHLFGLCATQAAGLAAAESTPAGDLRAGKAAADAVEAALLARHGFTSSALAFEGRRGLFALMSPGQDTPPDGLRLGACW